MHTNNPSRPNPSTVYTSQFLLHEVRSVPHSLAPVIASWLSLASGIMWKYYILCPVDSEWSEAETTVRRGIYIKKQLKWGILNKLIMNEATDTHIVRLLALGYKVQYHPEHETQLALTDPQPCPRALSKSPKAITGILNISNYMYIHVFHQFAFKCCHFTYNNRLNISFASVS